MYSSSEKRIIRQEINLGDNFGTAVLDIGDVKLTISSNGTIVLQANNEDVRVVTEGSIDATSIGRKINVRSSSEPNICKKSGDVNEAGLTYLGYNPHGNYEFYMAPTELIQFMPWDEAKDYVDKLEVNGWKDFRFATNQEFDVILNHNISDVFNALSVTRQGLKTPEGCLEHPGWCTENLWISNEASLRSEYSAVRDFEHNRFAKGDRYKKDSAWVVPIVHSYHF